MVLPNSGAQVVRAQVVSPRGSHHRPAASPVNVVFSVTQSVRC